MRLGRVAVLGGGPGGLYVARLLKLADPACEVVVHEQGEPDATFGFGVGLAAGTQRKLEAADPDTLTDLVTAGLRHNMTIQVDAGRARVLTDRLVGVARTELLAVLQRHAEKAGVELRFGARRAAGELDADRARRHPPHPRHGAAGGLAPSSGGPGARTGGAGGVVGGLDHVGDGIETPPVARAARAAHWRP